MKAKIEQPEKQIRQLNLFRYLKQILLPDPYQESGLFLALVPLEESEQGVPLPIYFIPATCSTISTIQFSIY